MSPHRAAWVAIAVNLVGLLVGFTVMATRVEGRLTALEVKVDFLVTGRMAPGGR